MAPFQTPSLNPTTMAMTELTNWRRQWRIRLHHRFPSWFVFANRVLWSSRVLRRGLPRVEVEYRTQIDRNPAKFVTTVRYAGVVHGVIKGEELWSNNGVFTIEQELAVHLDSHYHMPLDSHDANGIASLLEEQSRRRHPTHGPSGYSFDDDLDSGQ